MDDLFERTEESGSKYWKAVSTILDEMVSDDGHRTSLQTDVMQKHGRHGMYLHLSEYPQSGFFINGSVIVDGEVYIHPADDKGNAGERLPELADLVEYEITEIEEGLPFLELRFSTENIDRH